MNIDRAVFVFAGCVVLLGVVLSLLISPWWLGLSAFAGLNMIQAAFTGFCPAALAFEALGVPSGCAFPSSGIRSDSAGRAAHQSPRSEAHRADRR